MSLFPDLEIYGHGSKGGLDPNGSPLQALLQRNQFEEQQRGEPWRSGSVDICVVCQLS